MHDHGHYHSPEHKKKLVNRLSRIIGHLQKVKSMVENDEDCSDILV
ncbi:MAG: metal-sensing transcriptional repressor, partial [Lachnospiraceae bacterium]|nr:metal-sensing transcriptional repressor [Lachnospiraceae bacterium]